MVSNCKFNKKVYVFIKYLGYETKKDCKRKWIIYFIKTNVSK